MMFQSGSPDWLRSTTFDSATLVFSIILKTKLRSNCVKFYQLAEEIESKVLIDYTGNIVSENWDQLGPEELASGRFSKIQFDWPIGDIILKTFQSQSSAAF